MSFSLLHRDLQFLEKWLGDPSIDKCSEVLTWEQP